MDSTNPVGFLQEFCAKKRIVSPTYVEGDSTGEDHCREFSCTCNFLEHTAEGKGCTKNEAKRQAATAMVKQLTDQDFFSKPLNVTSVNSVTSTLSGKKNAISVLQEYCQEKGQNLPTYAEEYSPNGGFLCECIVKGKNTVGRGATKKVAKTDSAIKMLQELDIDYENLVGVPENLGDYSNMSVKNPISILMELCMKNNLSKPVFEAEPTLAGVFTVTVTVGEYVAKGVGTNKQGAKTVASSKILIILRAQGYTESIKPIKEWKPSSQCENVEEIRQTLDDLLPDFNPNAIWSTVEALSLDDSIVEVEPSSNLNEEVQQSEVEIANTSEEH